MREQYWQMYTDIKYRSCYYKHFVKTFSFVNKCISGFLVLTSISSVAAWGLWSRFPLVWSLLICVSQVIQALLPKLPYNDQIISAKFMLSALDPLLLSIDLDWMDAEYIHDYSDKRYFKLINKYQSQYSNLASQFFSGEFLPEIKYLEVKAQAEYKNYFKNKYHVEEV